MKKTKLILILLIASIKGFSQLEFSKWYFGQQAGLDFSTSPPTILTNGIVNTGEGVATICDNAGNLLFYTDGTGVANSLHNVMANGTGLSGNISSTQSAIIIKQPGSNPKYYIFTTTITGAIAGTRYSIVDMSLAAGLGSVTVLNAPLYTPTCEKQVAIRHCNGKDVWVLSHHYGSNEFRAYLLSSSGVSSNAVISAIGETIAGAGLAMAGHLKVSPDGKKLAMASATASIPANLGVGGFHLFDFDAATGIVSNSLTVLSGTDIPFGVGAYGLEFSPDGSKLYGTTAAVFTTTNSTNISQWNICAANSSAIIASRYSINTGTLSLGSIQKAIDNKLYITASNPLTQSLSVINNPNASGVAMNLVINGQSIAPKNARLGLPNFINGYTHSVPAAFTKVLACQSASFAIPPTPTFSSGCSATPYLYTSYLWEFGEPAAGATNSSTLTNPVHSYSATGTYSVTLILYSACTSDTLRQVVTVSTPGPAPVVSGNFSICKGDKHTYTASGGGTYSWSNGSTAGTVMLAPATTSVYSLSSTLNGCTVSKPFTITVNLCTGIAVQSSAGFHVFPNPFSEQLNIEVPAASELMITDLAGNTVLKTKVSAGLSELNTVALKPGIYLLLLSNENSSWRSRFVKTE